MIRFLTTCFVALSCLSGFTANGIYVAETAQGSNTGADAANAHSLDWANTVYGWPGGDTIHLVGTLTSGLVVGGNFTTIYFEPNAKFSAPYWPQQWWGGGAITIQGHYVITIDGGSNGVIECTDNGSTNTYHVNSCGVGAGSSAYLTVKNLTIGPLYNRTTNADLSTTCYGIQDVNTVNSGPISGIMVSNCVIHDCANGINTDFNAGCSNYTFIANTISNVNWGGNCADRDSNATIQNVLVASNHIWAFSAYDETNTPAIAYHHNGFYCWTQQGGHMTGVTYIGNTIGPGFGRNASSGMWIDSGQVGGILGALIANNLVLCATGDAPGNAMLEITRDGQILNNTFFGGGAGYAMTCGFYTGNAVIMGNIVVNTCAFVDNYGFDSLILDSNLVYNLTPGGNYSLNTGGSGHFYSLAEMQGMGYELHTLNVNPLLNSDGTLQAGSPAIGAGPNFSSIFTTDKTGNPRPATGAWTIGALEYSTGAPATTSPGGMPWALRRR